MPIRLDRVHRAAPVILGSVTLAGVAVLVVGDFFPAFSNRTHDAMAAFSLALIAVAYLIYQAVRRPAHLEWVKAILLAAAFLCWSANQVWPQPHQAIVLNDVAIALFVLDVFLVMMGWPPSAPDESFAETSSEADDTAPVRKAG